MLIADFKNIAWDLGVVYSVCNLAEFQSLLSNLVSLAPYPNFFSIANELD